MHTIKHNRLTVKPDPQCIKQHSAANYIHMTVKCQLLAKSEIKNNTKIDLREVVQEELNRSI